LDLLSRAGAELIANHFPDAEANGERGNDVMTKAWKWVWRVIGALALAALLAAALIYKGLRDQGFFREPVFETESPQLPSLQHPSVLVFSKTNSFIHRQAIPAAREYLRQLAGARGWSIYVTDSGAVFSAEDLARFDVVVWNNVTGDVLLPGQRQAFREWLEAGGGYVGLHAAGDNSHAAWPWYLDAVIRARFIGHPMSPQFQQARLRVEQREDPLVAALPDPWVRTDEWYSFDASPRAPDVRVLVTIDESSYEPGGFFGKRLAMGGDHPMIWKHCVGQGRVFYAAPGHTAGTYAEPEYQALLERAIAWAGRIGAQAAVPEPLDCER
jgi:type 1 glutamine amidotransferase